ncbi:hypothetical protein [Okeania sp. SIO1I7]|uniref:hypothetical protein n=1 Tax=Okeania sp. SIO1I7 TaxID=2607772 RepID=UPI0013FA3454|nr:hypothetical protein [Okeania sp. SIO1I7]NET26754.1 hypothetical protein [Okeania sp. SIO1I7]
MQYQIQLNSHRMVKSGGVNPPAGPSGGAGSIYCHASEKLMGRWGPTPRPSPSQEGNLGDMGRWEMEIFVYLHN